MAKQLATGAAIVMMVSSMVMAQAKFHEWAQTPPMGWNSWDCFGTAVNEQLTRENADYMAEHLKKHGWQYIVVDIQWYQPTARGFNYQPNAKLVMDEHGRLLPATNRFPSAEDGKGFKPLADYVHSKGLKLGIHLMRGIPKQAVAADTPILGTTHKASEIADKTRVCKWNPDNWGVDMSKPGAQEYYDSVFALIASWDVDFVKVDDLSRPYLDNVKEVEAIRKAIDKTGRPMVLSTSPGETPLDAGDHVKQHANMWRTSDDFWDEWRHVKEQFVRCRNWAKFTGPGHWPDADMLPFGAIRQQRPNGWTRFSKDEQVTVMTLWSLCRSPLMMGGHMPKNDEFTLSLLTNDEVIAVNQQSTGGRELSDKEGLIIWIADVPGSKDKYIGLFNSRDKSGEGTGAAVTLSLKEIGTAKASVRDLWKKQDLATVENQFSQTIPFHGAGLYRIKPLE